MSDDRYVFIVEWFDSAASLVRTYNFTYFLKDKSIEMFDIKNKRIFLKRCEYANFQLKDVFVGAILNIYSRQLKVIDYADEFTRSKFETQRGKGFLLIKPDAYLQIGKIINAIEESGVTLSNLKFARFSKADAEKFYTDHRGKQYFNQLIEFMTSDLVVGIEVLAENCIAKIKDIVSSVRASFATDQIKNAIHGSDSASSAARELEFFFSAKSNLTSPAYFHNCSCLLIKPHVITDGYVGQIIDVLLNSGYQISACEMFWLDRPSADEFHEVYKGVIPQYNQMIEEVTNGACIAFEIRQQNVVQTLREICGPHDPEMARTVRPKSIRAIYGKDKIKNAVHCTDLNDDGVLEVEYFFNILQRK